MVECSLHSANLRSRFKSQITDSKNALAFFLSIFTLKIQINIANFVLSYLLSGGLMLDFLTKMC